MPDEMDDASLNKRLRNDSVGRIRKALETIDDRDQDNHDAAVLQLVHDPLSKFCTVVCLDPDAEDGFCSIGFHTKRQIDGRIARDPLISNGYPSQQPMSALRTPSSDRQESHPP